MKGADIVMHNVVEYNDWMDEEVKLVLCCCRCLVFTALCYYATQSTLLLWQVVRLSVCNVEISWSQVLEFFKNHFTVI